MTQETHDKIMTAIMDELDKDGLNLGDGLTIWHSLGLFLFSQLDKENKDISVIYANMKQYLDEMQNMRKENNENS